MNKLETRRSQIAVLLAEALAALLLLSPTLRAAKGGASSAHVAAPAAKAPAATAAKGTASPAAKGPATGQAAGRTATPGAAGARGPAAAGAARGPAAPAASRAVVGRPQPANARVETRPNGNQVSRRADGKPRDVHDARSGVDVHHGLAGGQRVSREGPDHSRVVAERGGRGYVQHPYAFRGHEFGHRTYYYHGRAYDRFYGRYGYRGVYLDVYAPMDYYPLGFYGWAYDPWVAPIPYAWGWGVNPWYAYYGAYSRLTRFTPTPPCG